MSRTVLAISLREMIANSRKWAMARGLLQNNPVHGKEEWRIPTSATFSLTKTKGSKTNMTGAMTLEDCFRMQTFMISQSS